MLDKALGSSSRSGSCKAYIFLICSKGILVWLLLRLANEKAASCTLTCLKCNFFFRKTAMCWCVPLTDQKNVACFVAFYCIASCLNSVQFVIITDVCSARSIDAFIKLKRCLFISARYRTAIVMSTMEGEQKKINCKYYIPACANKCITGLLQLPLQLSATSTAFYSFSILQSSIACVDMSSLSFRDGFLLSKPAV